MASIKVFMKEQQEKEMNEIEYRYIPKDGKTKFNKWIVSLQLSIEEKAIISNLELNRILIAPETKHLNIFLNNKCEVETEFLKRLAKFFKAKYNPEGEVTIHCKGVTQTKVTTKKETINQNPPQVNKVQQPIPTPIPIPTQTLDKKMNGKPISIGSLTAKHQRVIIEGIVSDDFSNLKITMTKTKKVVLSFNLVDEDNGIVCKRFYKSEEIDTAKKIGTQLKGKHKVKVKGNAKEEKYGENTELTFWIDEIEIYEPEEKVKRKDEAEVKRVELHCHTRMSQMDAVQGASEVVEQAAKWGWQAIAITDHGVVQAYPEAAKTAKALKKKGINIKIIYGMEGYIFINDPHQKHANHIIILAKNQIGLKNLYELVSISHLRFFYKSPRIPKELLPKYREGLIFGSACEAGELVRGIVEGKSDDELESIANFYDYLEIQPIANNEFLIRSSEFPNINTQEDLININKKVASLAQKLNKPLIATCDAHFMNPEDKFYRELLMYSKGFGDSDKQPPLYLRTTEEMLNEFDYLDKDLVYDAVVTNPNMIANQIEYLRPIPELLYSPKLDGADEELRTQSYNKAKSIYGENLPKIVEDRLEQEIKPIIHHGFAALYMIAERLVKKSNEDGYIVGSRGSVGSSFVATMLGITEVNPLPAHYHCPNCKHSEFITDGSYSCGFDLPDKLCPKCNTSMKKNGHDIPFATFLGFDGDKVPDIDLNFSGEYQPKAHKYTEILFGKYNVYRAGTIATVADKTAFGFVKKYFDEHKLNKNGAYINSISKGCQGVKRTTGQHPAGIMVIPRDLDVHYFTPLQRPADDKDSKIITTHFDYHSISERLVKLDILGHDDPTILKMLSELTNVNLDDIPFDDELTMSLFINTKALGLDPKVLGTDTGTFGIPEFRTAFTRQMIEITNPQCFSDLVRISGFSHGTDVWLGNAKDLIEDGTSTLQHAISARDDIMTYLIFKGVDPLLSFKTMENVRKGKGISEDVAQILRQHDVPDWYISSCRKIKYLFPKAHATAYVMMAFRIAWFKVHFPGDFYAAYFSSRGGEFNADEIVKGDSNVVSLIKNLESKPKLDVKEKDKLTMLQVAHEMFLRGFSVLPVDLYRSHVSKFIMQDKKLLPPLLSLHGLGEVAANNIASARLISNFMSIEDLKNRTGINKANIETLRNHGCLNGLPLSNQLSLF